MEPVGYGKRQLFDKEPLPIEPASETETGTGFETNRGVVIAEIITSNAYHDILIWSK